MSTGSSLPIGSAAVANIAAANPWRSILYKRLRMSPALVASDSTLVTAAAIWNQSRQWAALFERERIAAGSIIMVALPAGADFLALLVATLFGGFRLAPLSPRWDLAAAVATTDAALLVATPELIEKWRCAPRLAATKQLAAPSFVGGKELAALKVELQHLADADDSNSRFHSSETRLILRSSGSDGEPRFIGLSDRQIFTNLFAHRRLYQSGRRVIFVLPCFHAFGLVLDLLPQLLFKASIYINEDNGRDPERLRDELSRWQAEQLCLVPLQWERLIEAGGIAELQRLVDGVIGGALIRESQIELLRSTRLRSGYGQTEAGPGVTLGEPGEWNHGWIGRPVGCEVRISNDGELCYRGGNLHTVEYHDGRAVRVDYDRWQSSGDLADKCIDGYRFIGRRSQAFKLANGRFFHPADVEMQLERLSGGRCALLHVGDVPTLAASNGNEKLLDAAKGLLPPALQGELRFRLFSDWPLTNKGESDRRILIDRLRSKHIIDSSK